MKNYPETKLAIAAVFLISFCFLWGCAGTQLRGTVYTPEKEPAKDLKILIEVKPGGKFTYTKADGSFLLKGLKPDQVYTIIATCESDNTRARVENVPVSKGKNTLPENKTLILAIHKPVDPQKDPTKNRDRQKGDVRDENP